MNKLASVLPICKRAFLLAAIMSCLLWQGTAMAQLSATLSANPEDYQGSCPSVITFTGTITSRKATRVTYVFLRSDGAIDTEPKIVDFSKPGSQTVTTTWTLGGNTLLAYSGWEAIKIINPGTVKSNEAKFKLRCTSVAVAADDKREQWTLRITQGDKTLSESPWNRQVEEIMEAIDVFSGTPMGGDFCPAKTGCASLGFVAGRCMYKCLTVQLTTKSFSSSL